MNTLNTSYTITLDYFREDMPVEIKTGIEETDNKEFIERLIVELQLIKTVDPYNYEKIMECIIAYGGLFLLKAHSKVSNT